MFADEIIWSIRIYCDAQIMNGYFPFVLLHTHCGTRTVISLWRHIFEYFVLFSSKNSYLWFVYSFVGRQTASRNYWHRYIVYNKWEPDLDVVHVFCTYYSIIWWAHVVRITNQLILFVRITMDTLQIDVNSFFIIIHICAISEAMTCFISE